MSNVSIYEKNWIDLVFEGKNKEYGAYQLRQQSTRTTLLALISGTAFFCSAIGLGFFLTSFGDESHTSPIPPDVVINVSNYNNPPEKEEPKKETAAPKKEEPAEEVKSKELTNPVVVKHTENPDDITPNKEIKNTTENPTEGGNTNGTNAPNTGGGTPSLSNPDAGSTKTNGVVTTDKLDKLPEYPGGINRFYTYVSKNITKPEIDEASGEITMSVIMSFVIEKDGSMTEIRALRSTDATLEREAIRVLKASKVKWQPGIKDGNPVRTLYMLPIKVKM